MLIFHERQLVRVLAAYEAHYNTHRPHRALDHQSPVACAVTCPGSHPDSVVRRAPVLGGLINQYRHAA
jgi:putative transposase